MTNDVDFEIVWSEPPDVPQTKRSKWSKVTAQLRARPGEWAQVTPAVGHQYGSTLQSRLKKKFGLECTLRTVGGETFVWARYPKADGDG